MIKNLLAYQEIDAKLYDIELKLSTSDERKKAVSAKKYIDGVEENVNKLDDHSASLYSTFENAINEHKKLIEQYEELVKGLEDSKSEHEVEFLVKKAEELLAKISTASKNIENISEQMQSVVKDYANIKKTTRAAQEQYSKYGSMYAGMKKAVQEQRAELETSLTKLAVNIDSNLLEVYKKKRSNKIFPVLYEVRGSVCGACNMELSMLELNKLKNGEIIECDQCGRLLYQDVKK